MPTTIRLAIASMALCVFGLAQNAAAQTTVQLTIASNPPNIGFLIEGQNCGLQQLTRPSAQSLVWTRSPKCRIRFTSPFSAGATTYVFDHWKDGSTANPREVDTPAENTTLTAMFVPASKLTVKAQCANQKQRVPCPASPAGITVRGLQPGGSVSSYIDPRDPNAVVTEAWVTPGSTFYLQIQQVTPGFAFLGWSGAPLGGNLVRAGEVPITMPATGATIAADFFKN